MDWGRPPVRAALTWAREPSLRFPKHLRSSAFICGFIAFAFSVSLGAQEPEPSSGTTAKRAVIAKKYMVVAAHPLAVDAGLAMLERGGSAADALVAVQLVLGLVEPQSSGLGGGSYLL